PTITLMRGVGQRLLPAPRLNNDALWQVGTKDLIPAFHRFSALRHNFLNARVEIRLQIGVALQAVATHELLDFWIRVPLLAVYFVSANVKKLIGKQLRHFSDKSVEKFVSALAGGIHRRIEDAPLALDGVRT